MKFLLLFLVICTWNVFGAAGAPFNSYDTMEEMVVPESKVLDFDNLTESDRMDLIRNQINITEVKLRQQALRAADALRNMQRPGAPMQIKQSATELNISSHVQNRKVLEKHIIGNIKHNIENNLMRTDTFVHVDSTHEMAFAAVCDLPKNTNQSFWDDDYTWNLYFRLPQSRPYTSLSSAILRLYMKGNSTEAWRTRESDNCKDPADPMIRVTVSVYWRKKNKDNSSTERKKRICSSIPITRNFHGWITLDMLLAVKMWDKSNRNYGIAIDVQDQDDNALPAAKFFQTTDCSEASKANATATVLPWNFFRNSLSWSSDEMDDVPHVPRIDVMMHKTIPQHHYFAHHPHHPMFRQKHHYRAGNGNHNVRYRLENPSSGSSSAAASTASGNSYEADAEVEIKQHPSVHAHHSLTKPHKKRHLNHHRQQQQQLVNSAESEEDVSASSSSSLEERKL